MSGYNFVELSQEAQFRWLRPAEVLFILQNYEKLYLSHEPPQKPPSGSLFLFNKRVVRFFRTDGHNWRRKKDGRTVHEAYERLKVGKIEAVNCYYAHGEENPNFHRRSYWMLEPAMEHIVLVHYRDIIGAHDIYVPPPSFSEIGIGQGSSYSHDGNFSLEVGGISGHQAPSISDMARDNMSSGGTHSYSLDKSAPISISDMARDNMSSGATHSYSCVESATSWNALNEQDSSPMMTENELQLALDEIEKALGLK